MVGNKYKFWSRRTDVSYGIDGVFVMVKQEQMQLNGEGIASSVKVVVLVVVM